MKFDYYSEKYYSVCGLTSAQIYEFIGYVKKCRIKANEMNRN